MEDALKLLQAVVFAKTRKHLTNMQLDILRGAFQNQTYDQIAETYQFSHVHTRTVGVKIWAFLSQVIGTKVNKKNFQMILMRQAKQWAAEISGDGLSVTRKMYPGTTNRFARSTSRSTSMESVLYSNRDFTRLNSHNQTLSLYYVPELEMDRIKAPIPELPGGQVSMDSAFYVERTPIESRCYDMITQPGALIQIQSPRQMGKSSLMARILNEVTDLGYHTVSLSCQLASTKIFTNSDKFLQWFCASVSKELGLPNQLENYWDDVLGGNYNTTDYFENYLLPQIDSPLVLGLDDLDLVFQYPEIGSDFLSMLRTWHEKAKGGSQIANMWKKLRLVVVNSSEVDLPPNSNISPFNVGLSIELPEFTQEEVQDLVHRHGLNWDGDAVRELMSLVGGHPYLVRKALYHIWHREVTLDELLSKSATQRTVYGEYLRRQFSKLQQFPQLLKALTEVASSPTPVELDRVQALKLRNMGFVHLVGDCVIPCCDLYRHYFSPVSVMS
ncbi:MAG TPA: serine/threonine protein kinase [Cyanobacteria bacterium UBA11149]|nr:serine/threonine protein kinase [Cyanobacteria bacterium UBA11367]HBE60151.1 serine/threonine protein kinase [Cyanobacteria bacterium UBA11366]HBK63879.1 serine/threonine protein kinase [Cyanobacteria bacterium UBA11166]HBR74173.1 serine/threonine protein kinase [Cyanobacteria bacterium UBA11159]HBS68845.1 serine/threonine protein kinase [Cyanobacteria bacterium UBA11153]HBW87373.1 serine/threonine protein kinase [Cyanobacteria bacterium UBA11149]HCA93159.1 serine/threonine protein kinase 